MKKPNSRKLNLNHETLIPLTNAELDAANGGITPTIVPVSLVASAGALAGFTASIAITRGFSCIRGQ